MAIMSPEEYSMYIKCMREGMWKWMSHSLAVLGVCVSSAGRRTVILSLTTKSFTYLYIQREESFSLLASKQPSHP